MLSFYSFRVSFLEGFQLIYPWEEVQLFFEIGNLKTTIAK